MGSYYYSKKDYDNHIRREKLRYPSKARAFPENTSTKEAIKLLALGLSQSDVARKLGLTRQRIGQIYLKHLTLERERKEALPTRRLVFTLGYDAVATIVWRGEITAERIEQLIARLETLKQQHPTAPAQSEDAR